MNVDVVYNKSCQRMDEVPNGSIDMIMTSCPYWGLRNYGEDVKEIWRGDSSCEHQWTEAGGGLLHENRNFITGTQEEARGKRRTTHIFKYDKVNSGFCQKCGAWYGQLGLEPTLEMYIDHLLLITLECKRVLKPTGVMWWNMGDNYTNQNTIINEYSIDDEWLRLLGWICTDGSVQRKGSRIELYQTKQWGQAEIERLLGKLEIQYTKYGPHKRNYKYFIPAKDSRKITKMLSLTELKELPAWLRFCSRRQVIILLEAIISGDGTRRKYDTTIYGSKEKLESLKNLLLEKDISCSLNQNQRGDSLLRIHQDLWNPKFYREKSLALQNYRLVIRMIDEQGWILRNDVKWNKPNAMPSSVKDRLTNKYEPVFCLVKNTKPRYYWNEKTGLMAGRKPPQGKQKEGIDWDWAESAENYSISDTKINSREAQQFNSPRARVHRQKEKNKKTYWHSLGYWFDLDAIREPHKDIRDYQRHAPFNYRVREAKKGHTGIIGVKSTKEEMARYNRKGIRVLIPQNTPQGIHRKRHNGEEECLINPRGKNPGDVWTIPTQPRPEAHFATFPDALCIKPILATCPQEICRRCGKPRVRITQTSYRKHRPSAGDDLRSRNEDKLAQARGHGGWQGNNLLAEYQTIGWTDCACNAGFEPGVVLDPFAGRGTALIMAKKLGRHYIGYELKEEYCERLIRPALEEIDPLFMKGADAHISA